MGALDVVVRRFCTCGVRNTCRCGLQRPSSGWTVESLAELRDLMREHGQLAIVAELIGETERSCNQALNALLGRTPVHALAALEAQCTRNWRATRHFSAVPETSREHSRIETRSAVPA